MPPARRGDGAADDGRHDKQVEFAAKDADEQVATGVVMVPNKVDRQRDFVRPDTVEMFAMQFENLVQAGEADGGLMHTVFPSDWMKLQQNEVLDEDTTLGGVEVPEGSWVQSWKYTHDDLWQLVADGVLEGYSIGAINVEWGGSYTPDELDDVVVPEFHPDDERVYELADGMIEEVSTVDIPAVPDAEILEKALKKGVNEYVGDRDGFIDWCTDRGHSEEDAERLWEVVHDAADTEGAGDPGRSRKTSTTDPSALERIGRGVMDLVSLGGSDTASPGGASATATPKSVTDGASDDSQKDGRTLSAANRQSLMANVDAALEVLEDSGVAHGMERFTDRDEFDFDLSEYEAREWGESGDESDSDGTGVGDDPLFHESGETQQDGLTNNNASGGDTLDDDMSTDDATQTTGAGSDAETEAPGWAAELSASLDELQSTVEQNSRQIEQAVDDTGDGSSVDDPFADAPEEVEALAEKLNAVAEQAAENNKRIEQIVRQSGHGGRGGRGSSDQLSGGAKTAGGTGEEEDDSVDALAGKLR